MNTLTSVLLVRYLFAKSYLKDILYTSEKRIFKHSRTFNISDVKLCQYLKKSGKVFVKNFSILCYIVSEKRVHKLDKTGEYGALNFPLCLQGKVTTEISSWNQKRNKN